MRGGPPGRTVDLDNPAIKLITDIFYSSTNTDHCVYQVITLASERLACAYSTSPGPARQGRL